MKKRPNTPLILLIRSPFKAVVDNPPGWAAMMSTLRSAGADLQIDDAAADYLEKLMAGGAHKVVLNLSGESDPMGMLEQLKDLDGFLDSVSTRYPSSLFHRHGFACNRLKTAADLIQFAENPEDNPFYHYAHSLWQPFDISNPPAWAFIYLESPGQMLPAVTLTAAWKKRWPQIPLQWAGPDFSGKKGGESIAVPPDCNLAKDVEMADLLKAVAQTLQVADHNNHSKASGTDSFEEQRPQPLIADQMPAIINAALEKKSPFIIWQWHGGLIDTVTKQLYAASRQGLWNHLLFDDNSPTELQTFAAANANIVHSFAHIDEPWSKFSDPLVRFPTNFPGYGRTQSMPGQPLWMALKSSIPIQILLKRHDPKKLMRMRVREDQRSLFEVGKNLSYAFKRPADLPEGHLDEIVRMVEAGGSVNTQFVRHNLERAYLIAYVEEEGVIVGNSSLKHPREEYIDAVSLQSGLDLHHYLERGYTSVRPEYRGLGVGVKLLEGLTERAGEFKIFSVIAESNIATQKMAIRNRTRRVATFHSQRANKEMSVWIPEWMLPEGIELPPQPDPDKDGHDGKDRS